MKLFVLLVFGFLLAVQFFAAEVHSSHYRGGTISYRPNPSSPYSVDFTFRLSFRRGAVFCDSSRVASRSLASTSFSNRWQLTRYYWSYSSSSYSGSANIYCSDFNAQEDWSEGNNSFTFTGSYGDDWWNVRITDGGNWIDAITYSNPSNIMHLDARVNRTVSGVFNNSSPVSTLPLTVYLVKGIPSVIRIPVEDPDGDIVRCRNASYQECYRGMCTYFPYGILDEGSCTLRYNGGGSVGQLFPIILKIEDFPPGTTHFDSSNSLGSVDLQFVVHIANKTGLTVTTYFASSTGRSGTIQSYTVPRTGTYLIQAGGARGGTHSYNYGSNPGTYYGGRGATKEGLFHLFAGTVLNIVVGQRGGNSVEVSGGQATTRTAAQLSLSVEDNAGTGGGGGSFVYTTSNTLLIAAGGGGGASGGYNGVPGQVGTSGTASSGSNPSHVRAGGSGGNPGACNSAGASYHGGVGAGWNGWGCARAGSSHGERGGSRLQGWVGGRAGGMNSGYNGGPPPGAVGGFGGGGGGSEDNGASGGGGGYSGGGSGTHDKQAGGGGGSYCNGINCHGVTGGNSNDYGFVKISSLTRLDMNHCVSAPCRNGGTCHDYYHYGYLCYCPYGFTGTQCETSLRTRVTCEETFMQIDLLDQYFPGLDWRSLHLKNTTCRATKTPYTMRLRAPLDGCGVTYVEHDKKIAFWNEVRNEPSLWPGWGGNLSAISRGENLIIPFYCEYGRDKIVSTSFSPSRKRVYASEGSFGNFTFTMDLYQSSSYSRPYSVFAYPVVVYPNQPLWVQYEVKNTNADLVVFAENCRATTSTDPDSFPQHVFLERGCVRDPTMVYWYNPYNNVQRFSIRSFRFVYSNTFLVYLHCELLVCHRNSTNSRCAQGCISGSRRRRETDDMDGSDTYGLSVGPMKGPNAKTETDKQGGEETSSAKTAAIGAGVGIAVVALLVGILVSVKMLHGRFKRVPPKEAPPPAIIMNQTVNSYEQHVMEDGERVEIEI